MIPPMWMPFAMVATNGKLQISWPTIIQGIIIGLVAGIMSSYVLLIRMDERTAAESKRMDMMMTAIETIKKDYSMHDDISQDDRRKLSERVSRLEAIELGRSLK